MYVGVVSLYLFAHLGRNCSSQLVFTALTLCVQHFRWAPWWEPHSGHKRHIKAKGTWNNIQWTALLLVGCCVWGLLLMEKAKRISGTVGTSNDLFSLGIILDYLFSLISLPPAPPPPPLPCGSLPLLFSSLANYVSETQLRFSLLLQLICPLLPLPQSVLWSFLAQMVSQDHLTGLLASCLAFPKSGLLKAGKQNFWK